MENLTIEIVAIVSCVITFFTGYTIGKGVYEKTYKNKKLQEQTPKDSIDSVKFINELNPIVIDIYNLFVSENGTKHFIELTHNIFIDSMNISIWAANDRFSRHFTSIPTHMLKTVNMTVDEINKSLSLADKTVLDRIVNAVKINNKEFLSRLFV